MRNIYDVLSELDISYERYDHEPLFTVQDGADFAAMLPGGHAKNLFVRTRKERKYYLVIIEAHKRANLKELAQSVLQTDFSFASAEDLLGILGVTPGSVSPFALINDTERLVEVIIDTALLNHNKLYFHPNINTATLGISTTDFLKFLTAQGSLVHQLPL